MDEVSHGVGLLVVVVGEEVFGRVGRSSDPLAELDARGVDPLLDADQVRAGRANAGSEVVMGELPARPRPPDPSADRELPRLGNAEAAELGRGSKNGRHVKRYTSRGVTCQATRLFATGRCYGKLRHVTLRDTLRRVRKEAGGLTQKQAAERIDKSRVTWNKWESGRRSLSADSARLIEARFGLQPGELQAWVDQRQRGEDDSHEQRLGVLEAERDELRGRIQRLEDLLDPPRAEPHARATGRSAGGGEP